ncbi:MAG: DinB family protein [Gemmatimonadales bacterium]
MIRANQSCLRQAVDLLDRLDDNQYRSPRGSWSPVGAQLRHVIEHYQCFLDGVAAGRIDYDSRRRDPAIESSRATARATLVDLAGRLDALAAEPVSRTLAVQLQCDVADPNGCWSNSTIGRELQFLVSHSVHHFALIKLLLAPDQVALPEEFGTAPSTLAHSRTEG